MIIDIILDRKDGDPYDAFDFYRRVLNYGKIGEGISYAMNYGTNADVVRAICEYIKDNGYNTSICKYVQGKKWI